jgi:8-hydroxy-5-deazaflavin:NADPH oxidoreductase
MRIGIIGAGEIGSTLVRQYRNAGHVVKVANSGGMEKLKSITDETGAKGVLVKDVVVDVDVIVISIPFFAVGNLPVGLFDKVTDETPIVDTCNYYPIVSGVIPHVEHGMHESVWVSKQIGRPVVKAYNSIFYRSLVHSGLPQGHESRVALPIAGDNKKSKQLVANLINDSGFDCYDYGLLEDSWRQEPGSPVYCTDLCLEQLKKSIVKSKKELLPGRRELGLKHIIGLGPDRWKDLVKLNRNIYESELDA